MRKLDEKSIRILRYFGCDSSYCYINLIAKYTNGQILDKKVKISHSMYTQLSRLGYDNEKRDRPGGLNRG